MVISQRLLYFSFVLLLAASLCFTVPASTADSLPDRAEDIKPLRTGDAAPAFTAQTVENMAYDFEPDALERPAVIISYRGGWCPYCNMHLSELRHVLPDLQKMGFDVLFISNDRPDALYASLEDQTRDDISGISYTILSDADLNAAIAFGTAFNASEKLTNWLDSEGRDYADSSIARHGGLAVPAVYIVAADGQIVFDYVNPNYKVRLAPEELLQAARALTSD